MGTDLNPYLIPVVTLILGGLVGTFGTYFSAKQNRDQQHTALQEKHA
jgi:hypothetical protein